MQGEALRAFRPYFEWDIAICGCSHVKILLSQI